MDFFVFFKRFNCIIFVVAIMILFLATFIFAAATSGHALVVLRSDASLEAKTRIILTLGCVIASSFFFATATRLH